MAEDSPNAQPSIRQIALQRIYLKDVSFEAPNAPQVFRQEWKPENQLNIGTKVEQLDGDTYEVVLSVTLTSKIGATTAFLVEVQQAGIFSFQGFAQEELGPVLGGYCPNTLFPYAREAVSDLVTKGSFPGMVLQPVNFDALYLQHQHERAAQAGAPVESKQH